MRASVFVCACVCGWVWVCICVWESVCECRVWEGNGHNARTRDAGIRVCVVGWPTARTERLPRRQESAERNAAVGAAPPYQNQYFPSRARHIPFVPVTSSPVVHMVFDGNLLFLLLFILPLHHPVESTPPSRSPLILILLCPTPPHSRALSDHPSVSTTSTPATTTSKLPNSTVHA